MRVIVINTGTEILLGDVLNTHLAFIAREVFYFGLRIDEQRTIPDGDAIQSTLADVSSRAEIVFVTGGLGPTSDDITRELVAGYLQLPLLEDAIVREAMEAHLNASTSQESAYDLAVRLGWVGVAKGLPKDLSTNRAHMSGFGRAGFGKDR